MQDAEAEGDQVMVAEIAVQQGHDLIQFGGSLTDAIRYSQRALDIATHLDDEALAYGARFSLGQAQWIAGDFAEGIRVLRRNLPENLRSPGRLRNFGTAGSLMMDSVAILGACHAYRGEFGVAFGYLKQAGELTTSAAFDFAVVQYHLNRAHLQRGDAAAALPLLTRAVQHCEEFGLDFTLAWLRGLLGYCHSLLGRTKEATEVLNAAIKAAEALGMPHVRMYAVGFLVETLLEAGPDKALDLAVGALGAARSGDYRAQEAEMLRLTAAACARHNGARAEALAGEGLAAARALGMQPEQGHAHRTLGDIKARSGDVAAAAGHRAAARAIYTELNMPYWLARLP
jgi:tetratricopeptide (TPR) repeat protein